MLEDDSTSYVNWSEFKMTDIYETPTLKNDGGLEEVVDQEKHVVDNKKLDMSAHILANHAFEYSEEDAKRVKKKIDKHLMPVLFFTGMISAIDKVIISNAALYGMKTDLHLNGNQYSWIGSIVALGFLSMEWPSSLLVQKFPLSKVLPVSVFLWSVFTMCQGASQSFAGMMVLRVFLGVAESPVFLICQTYIVMFYKSGEQPLRIAIFLASMQTLLIGPVSYGIGTSTSSSIAPWRLLFITFGGVTFLWSIALFFLLPDNPITWKVLTDREKYIALDRIKENQTGVENKTIKYAQIWEAMLDPKGLVLIAYQVCICVYLGGLTAFAALIVNSFGFTPLQTVLIGMPTGVIQTFSSVLYSYIGTRRKNIRCLTASIGCLIPVLGTALVWQLPVSNRAGRLTAYYITYMFWGCYTISASLPAMNTSGHTKKVTAYAMTFAAYSTGTLIGPQLFHSDYNTGYAALMGMAAAGSLLILVYAAIAIYQNRLKERRVASGAFDSIDYEGVDVNLLDLTDKQKKDFRYQY